MGGDPFPFINVPPRMTMRLNGPLPSDLSEPGFKVLLGCANNAQKIFTVKETVDRLNFGIQSQGRIYLKGKDDLPIGIQFIANWSEDLKLLEICKYILEKEKLAN